MKRKLGFLTSLLLASVLVNPALPAAAAGAGDCTIVGTNKAETIIGTNGPDVICAEGGSDTIYALGGNDVIRSGAGNDKIFAGTGNDTVLGESGNDSIDGGEGADKLSGGDGIDKISGSSGEDMIQGGAGQDNISGGDAIDVIDGGNGADTIRTGAGNDLCSADSSDIRLDPCTIDTKGPTFGATTTDVRQIRAGTLAVFSVNVSDVSGVAGVNGAIGGPPGWVTEWCGFLITGVLVSGTQKSGTYELSCTIPPSAVNETYTLQLRAADSMGINTSDQSIAFQVVGGSSDNSTPTVTKIDMPASATVGAPFVISVAATDESSVAGIYMWFMLEGGGFSDGTIIYASASEPRIKNETATQAVFEQDIVFDPKAPAGKYGLWLSVRDGVGNREFFATGRTIIVTR